LINFVVIRYKRSSCWYIYCISWYLYRRFFSAHTKPT